MKQFLRLHYAWWMAACTFAVLVLTAGIRATPSVMIVPLEHDYGWTPQQISLAVACNIAAYGLMGPFAASLIERLGLRKVVILALLVITAVVALSARMSTLWHFQLLWGPLAGAGTGVTALVMASIVAGRWFEKHRGLVLGIFSAGNATGQLVFLPVIAKVIEAHGWRTAMLAVAAGAAAITAVALLGLRDRPEDLGLKALGAEETAATPEHGHASPNTLSPLGSLRVAMRSRTFWVLSGSFFICGASTNGLIGTHLIPACADHGMSEVRAAGLLALMGIFDLVGTTFSGWLTDRFSSRALLVWYYGLRGLSLLFLPHALMHGMGSLGIFAIFYGLDWVATVPPTVRLSMQAFGQKNSGVIFGWIVAAHQVGASLAAYTAGAIRTHTGSYHPAFILSGVLCVAGAALLFTTPEGRDEEMSAGLTPEAA